jgi:hypothetical protein
VWTSNLDLLSSPLLSLLSSTSKRDGDADGTIRVLASAFPTITIRDYGEGQQCSTQQKGLNELNKLKVRSILPTLSRCALRMYLASLRGGFSVLCGIDKYQVAYLLSCSVLCFQGTSFIICTLTRYLDLLARKA